MMNIKFVFQPRTAYLPICAHLHSQFKDTLLVSSGPEGSERKSPVITFYHVKRYTTHLISVTTPVDTT